MSDICQYLFEAELVTLSTLMTIFGPNFLLSNNIQYKVAGAFATVSGPLMLYTMADAILRERHQERYMPHELVSRGLRGLYKKLHKS